jgi:hypothetical protein
MSTAPAPPARPPTVPPCPGATGPDGHHDPGPYRSEVRDAPGLLPLITLYRLCTRCGALGVCSQVHVTHPEPYLWESKPKEAVDAK